MSKCQHWLQCFTKGTNTLQNIYSITRDDDDDDDDDDDYTLSSSGEKCWKLLILICRLHQHLILKGTSYRARYVNSTDSWLTILQKLHKTTEIK